MMGWVYFLTLFLGLTVADVRAEAPPAPAPPTQDPSALLDLAPIPPPEEVAGAEPDMPQQASPPPGLVPESASPAAGVSLPAKAVPEELNQGGTQAPPAVAGAEALSAESAKNPSAGPANPAAPDSGGATLASPVGLPPAGAANGETGGTAAPPPELTEAGNGKAAEDASDAPRPPTEVSGPEVAIILAQNRFHPQRIRVREGNTTVLVFTTVNPRPAALIIERLAVQTWIAAEPSARKAQAARDLAWEVNREVTSNRVTTITLKPEKGTYTFHDAVTGASGEILVE